MTRQNVPHEKNENEPKRSLKKEEEALTLCPHDRYI